VSAELGVPVVCDNLATHRTPAIRDRLTRHPRFHLHVTPTGSSWINQVERWFGLFTDQLIRRGVHASVVALENEVCREDLRRRTLDLEVGLAANTAHKDFVKGAGLRREVVGSPFV